jgi:hypothetical protein
VTAEPGANQDRVADYEALYRALPNDLRFLPADGQGRRRISSMAFNDVRRRPSVDRAVLCTNGPADTRGRFGGGCGVLSLAAWEVRAITATHGRTGQVHGVDVEPVPAPGNPAHAEILGRPPFDTDRLFDRIKQALARIAVVALPPDALTPEATEAPPTA